MDSFNSHLQVSDNQCGGVLSIHFDFLLLAFVFNSFCQSNIASIEHSRVLRLIKLELYTYDIESKEMVLLGFDGN